MPRMQTDDTTHIEAVAAMRAEHREELAKLHMRIVAYRQALEQHGIEPPDHDDDELLAMWRNSQAVISTASHFVATLGTAKELLA